MLEQAELSTAASHGEVKPGMNKNHVLQAWGDPDDVNVSDSTLGKQEQWVYYAKDRWGRRRGIESKYVHFWDGKVSSVDY